MNEIIVRFDKMMGGRRRGLEKWARAGVGGGLAVAVAPRAFPRRGAVL